MHDERGADMSDDERKVRVEVDGVVYRGRHSVHQYGNRVYIDRKLVGVECDHDGNPLVAPLPAARVASRPWWTRLLWWRRP